MFGKGSGAQYLQRVREYMVLSKVGLTGVTGMLGRHVRVALEKKDVQMVAVSKNSQGSSNVFPWDMECWKSFNELDALFAGVQAVIHAGAMVQTSQSVDEGKMYTVNVRACSNLGMWALSRGVPLVHISSATVYADMSSENITESCPLGWSELGGFYGFTKLCAEDVLMRLKQQGLQLAIVRPSSLYGHGLPINKMINKFIQIAKADGSIELYPPVHDEINFIHAADVSQAILKILELEAWEVFNIASTDNVSIIDLAEACVDVAGHGRWVVKDISPHNEMHITRFPLNIDKAQSMLNWMPEICIKNGISMMMNESLYAGKSI